MSAGGVGAGAGAKAGAETDADAKARADRMIEKYMNPIAEPSRWGTGPAFMHELAKARHGKRHAYTDAAGSRRVRMPMEVILTSHFLRAGKVLPTVMLDIVDRDERPAPAAGPRRSGEQA